MKGKEGGGKVRGRDSGRMGWIRLEVKLVVVFSGDLDDSGTTVGGLHASFKCNEITYP